MLLNRASLAVAALASADPYRPRLHAVYLTDAETIATDGHCLGRITHPAADVADFPAVGITPCTEPLAPCLLPLAGIAALDKAIPRGRLALPILGHACVDVAATNANGTFRAVTTDLETTRPVEMRKGEASDFPDVAQVMPRDLESADAYTRVGYSATLLARVLKTAQHMGLGGKRTALEFLVPRDAANPLVIRGTNPDTQQQATFLVMPVRLPD